MWRGWAWKRRNIGSWRLRWVELDEASVSWYRYASSVDDEQREGGLCLLGQLSASAIERWKWEGSEKGITLSLSMQKGRLLLLVPLNPLACFRLNVALQLAIPSFRGGSDVIAPLLLSRLCIHFPLALGVASVHLEGPRASRAQSAAAVKAAALFTLQSRESKSLSSVTARIMWARSLIPGPDSLWAAEAEALAQLGPDRTALIPFGCQGGGNSTAVTEQGLSDHSILDVGGSGADAVEEGVSAALACSLRRCPAGSHRHVHLLLAPASWLPPLSCRVPRSLHTNDCYGKLLVAVVVHVTAGALSWESVRRTRHFDELQEAVAETAARSSPAHKATVAQLVQLMSAPPSSALSPAAFAATRDVAFAALRGSSDLTPWRALLPTFKRPGGLYRLSHGWPLRSAVALGIATPLRAKRPSAAAAAAAAAAASAATAASRPASRRGTDNPTATLGGRTDQVEPDALPEFAFGGWEVDSDGASLFPGAASEAGGAPDSPGRLRRDWGAATLDASSLSTRQLAVPDRAAAERSKRSLMGRLQYYFGGGAGRDSSRDAGADDASASNPPTPLGGAGAGTAGVRVRRGGSPAAFRRRSRDAGAGGLTSRPLSSSATPPAADDAGGHLSPYTRSHASRDPSFEVRSFSASSRGLRSSPAGRPHVSQAAALSAAVAPATLSPAAAADAGEATAPPEAAAGLKRHEAVSAFEAEALDLAAAVAASSGGARPAAAASVSVRGGEALGFGASSGGGSTAAGILFPARAAGLGAAVSVEPTTPQLLVQETVRQSARVATDDRAVVLTPTTVSQSGRAASPVAAGPPLQGGASEGGGSAGSWSRGAPFRARRRSLGRGRGTSADIPPRLSGGSSGAESSHGSSEAAPFLSSGTPAAAAAAVRTRSRFESFAEARRLKCARFLDQLLSIPEVWADAAVLEWLGALRREQSGEGGAAGAGGGAAAATAAAAAAIAAAGAPAAAPSSGLAASSTLRNTPPPPPLPVPLPAPPRVLHIASAPAFLRPGDVVLFACNNTPATLQRLVTACAFDHVGIVVDAGWRDRVAAESRARADAEALRRLADSLVAAPPPADAPSPASLLSLPSPTAGSGGGGGVRLPARHRSSSVVARFFGIPAAGEEEEEDMPHGGLSDGERGLLLAPATSFGQQEHGGGGGGSDARAEWTADTAAAVTPASGGPARDGTLRHVAVLSHAPPLHPRPAAAPKLHLTANKALADHRLSSADGGAFAAGGALEGDAATRSAGGEVGARAASRALASAGGHATAAASAHAFSAGSGGGGGGLSLPLLAAQHPYTLQLLESNSEGVQAYPLVQRLTAYGNGYCRAIAVRRLLLPFEEVVDPGGAAAAAAEEEEEGAWGGGGSGCTEAVVKEVDVPLWGRFSPCGPACVMLTRSRPSPSQELGEQRVLAAAAAAPASHARLGRRAAPCPCRLAAAWRAALERRLGAFLAEASGAPYRLGPEKALRRPAHWQAARPLGGAAQKAVAAAAVGALGDGVNAPAPVPGGAVALAVEGGEGGGERGGVPTVLWEEGADASLAAAAPPQPHYYCSELLATAYMRMGLLPAPAPVIATSAAAAAATAGSAPLAGAGGETGGLWSAPGPPAAIYWPNAWCAGSSVDAMLPLGCRLEGPVDVDPRGVLPLLGARAAAGT